MSYPHINNQKSLEGIPASSRPVSSGAVLLPGLGVAGALGLAVSAPADAYIGPGAGFAIVGGGSVILGALLIAVLALLTWPIRKAWRFLRNGRKPKASVKRLIIVGLDGQDPRLTDKFMSEGKLPNFKKLAEGGTYSRIASSYPSISPVAWSSFATGAHPAKHNIYDFLDRDKRTYLPLLSSTKIGSVDRFLRVGRYQIPLGKPDIQLLRKSKPFWTILGEHYIWSTVLRVPITFPPDKFYGAQLSAMCAPDLLGTQGTFLFFTTRPTEGEFKEGGLRLPLTKNGNVFSGSMQGPENSFLKEQPAMELPLAIETLNGNGKAKITLGDEVLELAPWEFSDWVTLEFKASFGVKVGGLCRIMLTELDDHCSLYVTPISLDPESPAMPVSHPSFYSSYLAKKIGPFSTLGLAEDTWALNEGIVDDQTFLTQSYDIDKEREEMFFASMEKLHEGSLVCVFDGTDRVQHMFWRYMEEGHPAAAGIDNPKHKDAIEDYYKHNDALVGRIVDKLQDGDMLMVLSDHGFTSFRRGVNLNKWLLDNGYLVLKPGTDGSTEWLRDVDWSQTKAYVLGLTGMFLNMKGRESEGIVTSGEEAKALKRELIGKLNGLMDDEKSDQSITEVFDTQELYGGPYIGNAPDLLIGYNSGYRTSWDCATGMVSGPVFEDNVKAWSGDHCVDPRQVPGVFFCTEKIDKEDPALVDIAPTALQLFGLKPPAHMDGSPLFEKGPFAAPSKA